MACTNHAAVTRLKPPVVCEQNRLPEHLQNVEEGTLMYVEIDIKECREDGKHYWGRAYIEDVLDAIGDFYYIDPEHKGSRSFSFEKDIEPAFVKALGKNWQRKLKELEDKLGINFSLLGESILASSGFSLREDLLLKSANIIGALLEIIEAASSKFSK